jgi:hypothetical protein
MKGEKQRKFYLIFTLFTLIVFVCSAIFLYWSGISIDWNVLLTFSVTIFGTLITLVISTQKQALEEHKVIHRLFRDFNNRYNVINDDINRIKGKPKDQALSQENKNILYDYFNLCGEEYLYYRRGYIYNEVWNAWCKGMMDHFNDDRIKQLWDEEEQTGSYYGLTYDEIKSNGSNTIES